MRKKIAVLGSTGSVGRQTLEVIKENPDLFELTAITAYSNEKMLEEQKNRFGVKYAELYTRDCNCLTKALQYGAETVVVATSGIKSLNAVLTAIEEDITVALANKETLVAGGSIINELLVKKNKKILPVDSEHSAVFQCLEGRSGAERIILTASGGPFYGCGSDELRRITPQMALKHPKWKMGAKITVDSATMMNKGLEIIEAFYLFGIEKIDVVVHPECVVHSMVEYADGAVLAQMAFPDMKLPVQYALTYPHRCDSSVPKLDLVKEGKLTFLPLKENVFVATKLAKEVLKRGGYAPTALIGADECAVEAFIDGKIGFCDIVNIVTEVVDKIEYKGNVTAEGIDKVFSEAYNATKILVEKVHI